MIAQTVTPLFVGLVNKPPFLNNHVKVKPTMKDTVRRFVTVFGICAITASLVSGCATGTPAVQAMAGQDLLNFQPDCARKEQQIRMLKILRAAAQDQMWDSLMIVARPFASVTDPQAFRQAQRILSGEQVRAADYHVYYLKRFC